MIITAELDETSQAYFNDLRRAHFPVERNHIDAHITLFHALPDSAEAVTADLREVAIDRPIEAEVLEPIFLGRGVAFAVASKELWQIRSAMALRWQHVLSAQDKAKAELHITVQTKCSPALLVVSTKAS